MKNSTYGYVRVSAKDQNVARQMLAMLEFGIEERYIFIDKQSGKDFHRPQYMKLLRKLKNGDTLVIQSIDRLGRSYNEIIEQWRIITKEKRAAIIVLDMPLLETRQTRDLTGTLIADLVLQILSFVAQSERESIKKRQAEGIAAARARGVHLGRPVLPVPENFETILKEWENGEITLTEARNSCNMTQTTFYRRCKEYRRLHPFQANMIS